MNRRSFLSLFSLSSIAVALGLKRGLSDEDFEKLIENKAKVRNKSFRINKTHGLQRLHVDVESCTFHMKPGTCLEFDNETTGSFSNNTIIWTEGWVGKHQIIREGVVVSPQSSRL